MKRYPIYIFLVFLMLISNAHASDMCGDKVEGLVTYVYDADTIKMDGKKFYLLGVDGPERTMKGEYKDCYSVESAKYLESLVLGKKICYDYKNGKKHRSGIGRRRINVYVGDTFVNAELIKNGYAFASRNHNYLNKDEFLKLESLAERKNRGIWIKCPVECYYNGPCKTQNW